MFCGVGMVEQSFLDINLNAGGFDLCRSPLMDFLSGMGFVHATQLSRELEWRGLQHWDTVCSSWVWLTRSVTKRTLWNILGDPCNKFTQDGNLMVSRMCVLVIFMLSKFCPYLLEQPGTSIMRHHPRMEFVEAAALALKALLAEEELLEEDTGLEELTTWMAAFGAQTAKRSLMITSHGKIIDPLHRRLTRDQLRRLEGEDTTDERIVVENGIVKRKVTGRKHLIRGTEVYPKGYGQAVCSSYLRWRSLPRRDDVDSGTSSESDYAEFSDSWPDAQLQSPLELLGAQCPGAPRVY